MREPLKWGDYMAVQLPGAKFHKTVIMQSEYAMGLGEAGKKDNKTSLQNGRSINIRGESDAVLMRKQIAHKRAKKAIEDAWAGDRKIAEDVETRKENLRELQGEIAQKPVILWPIRKRRLSSKRNMR